MKNSEIIKILEDIADLLMLKGENIFKARAYQKAARSIELISEDVDKLVKEERLREIPGIGEAIAKKLTELVNTGHLEYYDRLRSEFPEGFGTFLEVPGIGPHTALLIAQELHIASIEELEKAIEDGRVAKLPRMGEKTAQNILHQITALRKKKNEQRIPLGSALPVADSIMKGLKEIPELKNLTATGSLRRFKDMIGEIDLVGTADKPEAIIHTFTNLPQIREVLEKVATKARILVFDDIQVDLRLLDHDSFGSALQYSTGSKQHNIELRKRAERMGLSLSEYGITDLITGRMEKFESEIAFYERQGLDFIPPELREGQYEINLAEKGLLPKLIELADIQGDLHIHTNWSDGNSSVEDMVKAAIERNYKYIAITDHSVGLGIAHGLSADRILQQINEIRSINRKYPKIRIFSGLEVDIKADGTLDISNSVLAKLDIVLASVHSSMNQNEEQMTQRIITAMENPFVNVIAHPTCRILGEREPVAVNIESIFKAAIKNNVALEISAMPSRLDLKDSHVYQARDMGVKLIINTDAHRIEHLDFMRFGIGTARRGWCESKHIVNTLLPDELVSSLTRAK